MEPAALSIGGFLAAYSLTLIIPGQNMFAIASCSALQGMRATLPLSLGIACGAACLCLAILAGMGSVVQIEHLPALRIVMCMLVMLMAYRLFQLHICETPSGGKAFDSKSSLLVCGFLTAFLNPTTALFFVARSMPQAGIDAPPLAVAAPSVLMMMLAFSLFVSVFCSRPAVAAGTSCESRSQTSRYLSQSVRAGGKISRGVIVPCTGSGMTCTR